MAFYNSNSYSSFNNQPANNYSNYNLGNQNGFNNYNQGPSITSVAIVRGEEGARNYLVASGNTVLLIDFESNQFWLKSTAPNGMAQPLRSFSFSEILPKVDPSTEFVSKKEFDDLKNYLDSQFHDLKSQLYKTKRGQVNDKSDVK